MASASLSSQVQASKDFAGRPATKSVAPVNSVRWWGRQLSAPALQLEDASTLATRMTQEAGGGPNRRVPEVRVRLLCR